MKRHVSACLVIIRLQSSTRLNIVLCGGCWDIIIWPKKLYTRYKLRVSRYGGGRGLVWPHPGYHTPTTTQHNTNDPHPGYHTPTTTQHNTDDPHPGYHTPTTTQHNTDDSHPGYHTPTHAHRRTCSHVVYISYIIFFGQMMISQHLPHTTIFSLVELCNLMMTK